MTLPLVHELPQAPRPEDILAWVAALRAASRRGLVFFDSAQRHETLGRYSFIAIDPFHRLTIEGGRLLLDGAILAGDPFVAMQDLLARYPMAGAGNLPPFQGGLAGYLGYDLNRYLERLRLPERPQESMPDLLLGAFDLVLAIDHARDRAFVFSSGWPEREEQARRRRATERRDWLLEKIAAAPPMDFAPVWSIAPRPDLTAETYRAMVRRALDYIYAGDIYQANITQRYRATLPADLDRLAIYAALRRRNPATFAAFLEFGEWALLSSSPERFLKLAGGTVETRPIKGTRRRGRDEAEDAVLAADLLASAKDRAENLMIVDLLRNDLSRVCRIGSVRVPILCGLESYASVHHLVSVVTGELAPGQGAVDLLRAAFPGGSITGAPKIRAMEIIGEIEPHRRGAYCGALLYLGFDGAMDSNIVIRTLSIAENELAFQVGGGIVADSDPEAERTECDVKAAALLASLANHDPAIGATS